MATNQAPGPQKPQGVPQNRSKETTLQFADRMLSILKYPKSQVPGNVPLQRGGQPFDLDQYQPNSQAERGVPMEETDIRRLIWDCRDIVMSQPMLIEIEAPTKVCGDTHGQYHDVLRLFNMGGWPPQSNYMFLGDYVDRGRFNVEVISLMMALKIRYPENFHLLRGNHESAGVNKGYGFYDECKRKYSIKLWKYFTDLFNCLPICGIISNRIIGMHGCISPELTSLEQVRRLMRPIEIPESGLMCDMLWSDPDKSVTGWGPSGRGAGFAVGPDVVSRFLEKMDMDLIVRAHQVVEDGYEFFAKRQLVTIFSAPNYQSGLDNAAGIMNVDENLTCSFQILKPANRYQKANWGTGRHAMNPDGQPRAEFGTEQALLQLKYDKDGKLVPADPL